ncbi:MAG: MFS transporter [Desulfovibrionaceae bacterium]|nr:MFS transporter [Desulfovibrionaceae bacterium]
MLSVLRRKSSTEDFRFEFLTLLLVTFTTYCGFYFPQPLLATLAEAFQVSPSDAGLCITVVIAPFAVGPFVYGSLLRYLTLRKLLVVLMLTASLALLGASLVDVYPVLLGFRFVQGMMLPGILMCITAYIALRYRHQALQKGMVLYAATTLLGAFGGRVLGSWISTEIGWRNAFRVFGSMELAVLIFVLLFVREVHEKSGHDDFNLRDILNVLKSKPLLLLILITPLAVFCNASMVAILPFYLKTVDPLISDAVIGLVYMSGFISAAAGLLGRQAIRICRGEWNVILVALCGFALCLQGLFLHNVLCCFIAMLFTSFFFTLINGMVPGLLNRSSHMAKGLTNSVYLSVYYILGSTATYFPVVVYTHWGLVAYDMLALCALALTFAVTCAARRCNSLDEE